MIDIGLSRRWLIIGISLFTTFLIVRLTPRDELVNKMKPLWESAREGAFPKATSSPDTATSPSPKRYGEIKDRVAVITDTQHTARHIPLILHFHSVLGPEWPIVYYTTEENIKTNLLPPDEPEAAGGEVAPADRKDASSRLRRREGNQTRSRASAVWRQAVEDGRITLRVIPPDFDLSQRESVNLYLSRPWLWESLAPAQHVLVFQTDAMLCGNAHRTVDSFLQYAWVGAPLSQNEKLYNGGLSLRNRTMMLDILADGNNWEAETASGEWTLGGEDVWFSRKMDQRGANLPDLATALEFAVEYDWAAELEKQPLGYHKVHKYASSHLPEITKWCPEIDLAAPGTLGS